MTSTSDVDRRGIMASGCAIALASSVLTCLMLFINGSLVWALISAFSKAGPSWFRKPEVSQFLLFVFPVLLVIAEWMMIDYLRARFRQSDHVEAEES